MKAFIICLFLLSFSKTGFNQQTRSDTLRLANHTLDTKILDELKYLDFERYDFMMFRVRDTANPLMNQCLFIVSKDSCSKRYKLAMNVDFKINNIVISNTQYGDTAHYCPTTLLNIQTEMADFDTYFNSSIIPFVDMDRAPFFFFGKIDGKYTIEFFDQDFKPTIYSGSLYDIICAYFYMDCE